MGPSGELCAACAPHTVVLREWIGGHGSVETVDVIVTITALEGGGPQQISRVFSSP